MNDPCARLIVPVRFMMSESPIATTAKNAPRTRPLKISGATCAMCYSQGCLGWPRHVTDRFLRLDALFDEVGLTAVDDIEDIVLVLRRALCSYRSDPHRPHQLMIDPAVVGVAFEDRFEVDVFQGLCHRG